MSKTRCPGQNTQFWGPEDIFDIACPECGRTVEFFKDDPKLTCPGCSKVVFNPRIDLGCALWCPQAAECIGPEKYKSLTDTAKSAQRRKEDMRALLATITPEDKEVRELFKKLYISNKDTKKLIDTDALKQVQSEDPDLFNRATDYFSKFKK